MTLTELKYIVAVARERHFGRAAEACFVSQPTLSVAIRKLEEELEVQIFERGNNEVTITPLGQRIVEQAQRVLEESATIREIAEKGKDPKVGPLRLGVIHTVGPYLLPKLVPVMLKEAPQMPLLLQEDMTTKLLESLKLGDIDVAIVAEPTPIAGFVSWPVYEEPFVVVVPNTHPWADRPSVDSAELKEQTMLLLGSGHCFRDQVLRVCPELSRFSQASAGIQKTFEGSSLETIRHMVASGIGVTVLPWTAMPPGVRPGVEGKHSDGMLTYLPFEKTAPVRQVMLVWRKSFGRVEAIEELHRCLLSVPQPGVSPLVDARPNGPLLGQRGDERSDERGDEGVKDAR